ncbi:MAG: hypothetical protein GY953_56460, partial [bacterium]|nr:hypothetical protein [bacterium]
MTGHTSSIDFPTLDAPQAFHAGLHDAYLARFSAAGDQLVFSTYFGGAQSDGGTAVAVDGAGQAVLAGTTQSTDFPTTNPFQASSAGILDSCVALFVGYIPAQPVADSVSPSSGGGSSQTFQFTYRDANGYEEMAWVFALFHIEPSQADSCYVQYNHTQNTLWLLNDAGNG